MYVDVEQELKALRREKQREEYIRSLELLLKDAREILLQRAVYYNAGVKHGYAAGLVDKIDATLAGNKKHGTAGNQ